MKTVIWSISSIACKPEHYILIGCMLNSNNLNRLHVICIYRKASYQSSDPYVHPNCRSGFLLNMVKAMLMITNKKWTLCFSPPPPHHPLFQVAIRNTHTHSCSTHFVVFVIHYIYVTKKEKEAIYTKKKFKDLPP